MSKKPIKTTVYCCKLEHKSSVHITLTNQLNSNLYHHTANEYCLAKYIAMLLLLMFSRPFNPAPGCFPALPICSMLF